MEKRWILLALLLLVPMAYALGSMPVVTINVTDGTTFTNNIVNLSYVPFDNTNITRCELWGDFGQTGGFLYNQTNKTRISDRKINYFDIRLANSYAPYYYNIKCFDNNTLEPHSFSFANKTSFVDSVPYSAGLINNTTPNWIPQYPAARWINVTTWKTIHIDAYTEWQGDRDQHITLNTSTSNYDPTKRLISIEYQFNISACNSTWKLTQGVNPIGSAAYLYYADGDNFIDVEWKVNSNNSLCNATYSQLSVFKRFGGISTALIPFTQYYLITNRTYDARIDLMNWNATHYNITIWLNGTIIASSTNIEKVNVSNGYFLLEAAGTITDYDDITVKQMDDFYFYVASIRACTFFERLGYDMIMLFFTLAVLAITILYARIRGGFTSLSLNEVLVMFLVVVLGAIFSGSIADIIVGSCF